MNFLAGLRPAGIVLALSLAALPATRAAAQVDCARLASQIAALGNGGGGSQQAAAAANRQQAELGRLAAHARSIGCNRAHFLFFDDRPAQCDGLNARIEGLRASVAQLQRAAYGGGGARQQLQNQFDAYCRGQRAPDFIERLFGGRDQIVYPPAGQPDDGAIVEPQDSTPRGGSEAICVRTCDGSFFPISYSARRASLGDLQEMCTALCPASEVKLYTRAPRDMKTAVSIDGDAYTNLANAFKYEKQVVPECSCRKPGQSWAEALVDAEKLLGEGRKGDIMVTPEKAEELSRPQQPGQAAGKAKTKGKAAAFDPEALQKLLDRQKRAADAESAAERDAGARAPTASQDSSGIDFRQRN